MHAQSHTERPLHHCGNQLNTAETRIHRRNNLEHRNIQHHVLLRKAIEQHAPKAAMEQVSDADARGMYMLKVLYKASIDALRSNKLSRSSVTLLVSHTYSYYKHHMAVDNSNAYTWLGPTVGYDQPAHSKLC